MTKSSKAPESWLAFELNILRRLDFKSAALPNAGSSQLGAYLKNWGARVTANDVLGSNWAELTSAIENNDVILSDELVENLLEDAYVPGYEFRNPALAEWFGETDGWWFNNVRSSIERISDPIEKAIALDTAMKVGDYALSFEGEARRLRQPFSKVFRKFLGIRPIPVNNGVENSCQNRPAKDFIAEVYTDLLLLKLRQPRNQALKAYLGRDAWKEEFYRGSASFWLETEKSLAGQFGDRVETKSQYLRHLEDFFLTAAHIPIWAVVHTENDFVTTQDIVEVIGNLRRVDTIFTKDFSELLGLKAVVITASAKK